MGVTGYIPAEEHLKEVMDFSYRLNSVIESSHVFSSDHNQDSKQREPDLCNHSPQEKLEENVSILVPCNSCGNMKIVGRVLRTPYLYNAGGNLNAGTKPIRWYPIGRRQKS